MPEKTVFISHSSRDYETAKEFCDVFEANGLGCWIAPRDIPYGAEWAERIIKGVRASSVLLVLLTEHAAASKHVIREINAAVQKDIRVLYVRLDAAPLSDGLFYYLDVLQEIDLDLSPGRRDRELLRLAVYIKTYVSELHEGGTEGKSALSLSSEQEGEQMLRRPGKRGQAFCGPGQINAPFTIEEELSRAYEKIFPEGNLIYGGPQGNVCSPFRKKLMERLCGKILQEITCPSAGEKTGNVSEKREAAGAGGPVCGFHFEMEESEGFTMAFAVKRHISAEPHRYSTYPERLKYYAEDIGDHRKKLTFIFCDEAYLAGEHNGMELVLLKFLEERDLILIFEGFWDYEEGTVRISDAPCTMPFHPPMAEERVGAASQLVNVSGSVRVSPFTAGLYAQPSRDGTFRWYSDEEGERFLIIDLTEREVVCSLPYCDVQGRKESRILELERGHRYLTMRCGETRDATAYEIGRALFTGAEGLERNWLKAAEYFDRAGSPEAAFFLGRIFSEDPLLSDEEDARYYFQAACGGGITQAAYCLQKFM